MTDNETDTNDLPALDDVVEPWGEWVTGDPVPTPPHVCRLPHLVDVNVRHGALWRAGCCNRLWRVVEMPGRFTRIGPTGSTTYSPASLSWQPARLRDRIRALGRGYWGGDL